MGEAFSVKGSTLCQKCTDQFVSEHGVTHTRGEIARLVDPTICVHCAADGGEQEWPTIANLPACTKCDNFFRNRPFPTWLKISFVVFLCVATGAFVYNLRFFLTYVDIVRANRAMEAGRIELGVKHFAAAADRMPELPELALFKAQQLELEDKNDEAIALVRKSRPNAPPQLREAFQQVELGAQMGQAFNQHDYDAFLSISQQLMKMRPDDPSAIGSVASAYACKYATTGDAKFRDEAKRYLEQAREHAGKSVDELKEYENRILHRLETREIIDRKQFNERFPNGWKPEAAK
jgi:tetratricopeptide (TPR) repeat protein